MAGAAENRSCPWARKPLAVAYHDEEWGVPVHDDRVLFEFLVLEGARVGLLDFGCVKHLSPETRRCFAAMAGAVILGVAENLTLGVLAHEGSTVIVCLNSLRLLFLKDAEIG